MLSREVIKMVEVKTKYGIFHVEETEVDYQVLVYFSRYDEKIIKIFQEFFDNLGKYEKVMKGARIFTELLGINNNNAMPPLTEDDIEIFNIEKSNTRVGCIDIFIRSKELTDQETMFKVERKKITPNQIAAMIENIEKYEMLQQFLDFIRG